MPVTEWKEVKQYKVCVKLFNPLDNPCIHGYNRRVEETKQRKPRGNEPSARRGNDRELAKLKPPAEGRTPTRAGNEPSAAPQGNSRIE